MLQSSLIHSLVYFCPCCPTLSPPLIHPQGKSTKQCFITTSNNTQRDDFLIVHRCCFSTAASLQGYCSILAIRRRRPIPSWLLMCVILYRFVLSLLVLTSSFSWRHSTCGLQSWYTTFNGLLFIGALPILQVLPWGFLSRCLGFPWFIPS